MLMLSTLLENHEEPAPRREQPVVDPEPSCDVERAILRATRYG